MDEQRLLPGSSLTCKQFFKNWKDNIPSLLYKLMILLFIVIFAYTTFISNYDSPSLLVFPALFAFAAIKFFRKHNSIFDTTSDIMLLIALSIACFAVKFLWIYNMRLEPEVDYATFYYTAADLAKNWVRVDRYVALFPHILGYSTFLSIFFKIFGHSVFLASLLNVILSVISGVFIYKITKNLISTTAAVFSYLLWIICPSQTIYNSLVLSDPLYTTLILAFVYLLTVIVKKEATMNWVKMILFGVLSAVILQGVNVSRPVAAIFIIAMFIWIFILRFKDLFNKAYLAKWIPFFAAMLVVYFALGSLWNVYFTSRIGEAPASVPGYNIYVGFNPDSSGGWNWDDSQLLYYYSDQEGATAEWAQQQMLNEAKNRITSGNIDFTKLLKNKLNIFLGEDSVCVGYTQSIIKEYDYLCNTCNVFYYFIVLLSLLGAYKMLKTSHRSAIFILPLFVIGITCAQMLVEVAPRYHYSIIPFLIMIPQFYLFNKNDKTDPEDI